MSNPLIDDSKVDALNIVWEESPRYSGPRVVDAPPELRMIRDFLSTRFWQHFVQFIAPGVLRRHGRISNESGFTFQSDLDPGDERFEGVQMVDPIDTIYISEGAFDRLMSRFFNAVIDGARRHQKPVIHADWWPELVSTARDIERRAYGKESGQ
jgi:hypothetical protein